MNIKEIIDKMTLEEKAQLLTGSGVMSTFGVERLGVPQKELADGPHGVRHTLEENCTAFPNICNVGASWDKDLIFELGEALACECIKHNVDMLLAPGINIKRSISCGRNFEYFSEDPVVSGELSAAYINGLQSKGIAASLKHFALNNQETNRTFINVEVEERVMREIYLKGFEIAIKKSNPVSVMCSYNKIASIWASENKHLLTEILRDEWGYQGFVVSDWNAVHNVCRAIAAGLDLQMPSKPEIAEAVKEGIEKGIIDEETVDKAVERMLRFSMSPKALPEKEYDRNEQHAIARRVAANGIVLLKNDENVLPITKDKYKKISFIGEYADSPLIAGQGSSEIYPFPEYIESPLEETRKILGDDADIKYWKLYEKLSYSPTMLFVQKGPFNDFNEDSDLVVIFIGAMQSEDSEYNDRISVKLNPNQELFIDTCAKEKKKIVVVIQSGAALVLGSWVDKVHSIVQMWLGGEAAGGAIADVLTGRVNPSGKLTETFPNCIRPNIECRGDGKKVVYAEGLEIGYRYYDRHTDEIVFPFGHGLSYTTFAYSDLRLERVENDISVRFKLKNTGDVNGAEVVQLYVGKPNSVVTRPVKELKAFEKVFLNAGEEREVKLNIAVSELAYYNVCLREWITEPGSYDFYISASSQDIRLKDSMSIMDEVPYTMVQVGEDMVG